MGDYRRGDSSCAVEQEAMIASEAVHVRDGSRNISACSCLEHCEDLETVDKVRLVRDDYPHASSRSLFPASTTSIN